MPYSNRTAKEYMAEWRVKRADHLRAYAKRYYAEHHQDLLAKKAAKRNETREQINAYAREYYQRKRSERLAYAAAYRKAHPEALKVANKSWREGNKEAHKALRKAWHEKHPHMAGIYGQKRRARKAKSPGTIWSYTVPMMLQIQEGQCAYCRADLSLGYHLDHKQPLSRGGTHTNDNVHLTCPACNLSKHTKTHEEFQALLGISGDFYPNL